MEALNSLLQSRL
jgi:tetratricopeptide (TPR) repeat protein